MQRSEAKRLLLGGIDNQDWLKVVVALCLGISPNTRSANGLTVLHVAAAAGQADVAAACLAQGADANAQNREHRQTPAHLAASRGDITMLTLLRRHGSSLNAKDCDGETPLFYAARNDQAVAVEWLIKNGAEIRELSAHRSTALHAAVSANALHASQSLLRRGADPHAEDRNGKTPESLARATDSGNKWMTSAFARRSDARSR